jgi:glycerophosphoryl diester phosphodiesterase
MKQRIKIIGHRGASAKAPENTMAAFNAAIDAGADGIEFDVRLTKDHVPVVIHDDTLRRTAGLSARVDERNWEELKTVDVGSWFRSTSPIHFTNETLPTLQQVLDLFIAKTGLLYLEMKSETPRHRDVLADRCCSLINDSTLKERIVVECFDLKAIECIKRLDPTIRTAALFEPSFATPPLIASGQIIGAAQAVAADEIALHHRLASQSLCDRALSAGFKIVVWTVDDPAWLKRAEELGVSALITNDPAVILDHRE